MYNIAGSPLAGDVDVLWSAVLAVGDFEVGLASEVHGLFDGGEVSPFAVVWVFFALAALGVARMAVGPFVDASEVGWVGDVDGEHDYLNLTNPFRTSSL